MGDAEGQSGIARFIVFLDENHCRNPHLLAALGRAGVPCEKHLDHFRAGTDDLEWLPSVGHLGWCLLTSDSRIKRNRLERRAVQTNNIRLFYFSRNNMLGSAMGGSLERALPHMRRLFQGTPAPFAASISREGRVTLRETFEADSLQTKKTT